MHYFTRVIKTCLKLYYKQSSIFFTQRSSDLRIVSERGVVYRVYRGFVKNIVIYNVVNKIALQCRYIVLRSRNNRWSVRNFPNQIFAKQTISPLWLMSPTSWPGNWELWRIVSPWARGKTNHYNWVSFKNKSMMDFM